jgi:hypothetical protein
VSSCRGVAQPSAPRPFNRGARVLSLLRFACAGMPPLRAAVLLLLLAANATGAGGASFDSLGITVEKLAQFMAEPFNAPEQMAQATKTGLIDLSSVESVQTWILHQMLLHEDREEREGFMICENRCPPLHVAASLAPAPLPACPALTLSDVTRCAPTDVGLADGTFIGYAFLYRKVDDGPDGERVLDADGEPQIDLVYTYRAPGQSGPAAHDWTGAGTPTGQWIDNGCATGATCHSPTGTFVSDVCLAGPCTRVVYSCDGTVHAGGSLDSSSYLDPPSCIDRDVRLYSRTDGIHRSNPVPSSFAGDLTVDQSLAGAKDCQALCDGHADCSFFSYEWEAEQGRYFHKCYLKEGFTDPSCDEYVAWAGGLGAHWAGASGPKTCGDGTTDCIMACVDYGGGGACDYAPVVAIIMDRKDWILPPFRWKQYDPREREWYIQGRDTTLEALETAEAELLSGGCLGAIESTTGPLERWTVPYNFSSGQGVGISATRTLLNRKDELVGVVAVDYSLNLIGRWLASIFGDSSTTVVFVVERHSGRLIGSSLSTAEQQESDRTPLMQPNASSNVLVRTAAAWMSHQSWSPPNSCERCGSACVNCTTIERPPDSWLAANPPTTINGTMADTVRRFHASAAIVVGESVRNLQWVVVMAQIEEESCATIHATSGGNMMQPDEQRVSCICRRGYRKKSAAQSHQSETATCEFCNPTSDVCGGNDCIECLGGDKVYAKPGYWIQNEADGISVYRCTERRCLGTLALEAEKRKDHIDDKDEDARSQNASQLCGGSERANADGDGNCCAPGHEGKLCAVCSEGYVWVSDDRFCIECQQPNYTRLVLLLVCYLCFVLFITWSKHYSVKLETASDETSNSMHGCICQAFNRVKIESLEGKTDVAGGTEIPHVTFFLQTYNMLGVEQSHLWWLSMLFSVEIEKGGSCLFPASFYWRAFVDIALAPVAMVLFAVLLDPLFNRCVCCWRRRISGAENRTGRGMQLKSVLLEIVFANMTPLIVKTLKMWYCTATDDPVPYGDGISVLHNAPFIECTGLSHTVTKVLSVVLVLCGLGCMFPLWMLRELNKRKKLDACWEDEMPEHVTRNDWLVTRFALIKRSSWWWTAFEMSRRTVIAFIFARRNSATFEFEPGTQFNFLFGLQMDWRTAVVVVLSLNLVLSSTYRPWRDDVSNVFYDLMLHVLVVLYVLFMGNEKRFFLVVTVCVGVLVGPLLVYTLVKKAEPLKVSKRVRSKTHMLFGQGGSKVVQVRAHTSAGWQQPDNMLPAAHRGKVARVRMVEIKSANQAEHAQQAGTVNSVKEEEEGEEAATEVAAAAAAAEEEEEETSERQESRVVEDLSWGESENAGTGVVRLASAESRSGLGAGEP